MMKIFFPDVNGNLTAWNRVRIDANIRPETRASSSIPGGIDEKWLEDLIIAEPALVMMGELGERADLRGRWVAFSQLEVSAFNGRTIYPDIVFFSDRGEVVVVEVKLRKNPEIRDRQVVAQVLEYAACLAALEEDDLVRLFSRSTAHQRWTEVIAALFPEIEDSARLADTFQRRLASRQLHLSIACDEAPNGLRELVAGVVGQEALGEYSFRVSEIALFAPSSGPGFVAIPSVRIATETVARTAVTVSVQMEGERPQTAVTVQVQPLDQIQAAVADVEGKRRVINDWDRDDFVEYVQNQFGNKPTVARDLAALFDLLQERGFDLRFGNGVVPAFGVVIPSLADKYQIVNITAQGRASTAFGNMRPEVRARVRAALCDAYKFTLPETNFPYLPVSWLQQPLLLVSVLTTLRDTPATTNDA
jgi:hypothetical protein